MLLSGNRGAGGEGELPENTIESAKAAFSAGADRIHVDVTESADGQLVLLHDDTLERTTSGTGCAGDRTLAELQQLDAAVGTPFAGTGIRIPTLDALLSSGFAGVDVALRQTQPPCPPTEIAQLAQNVVQILNARATGISVSVTAFDLPLLQAVHALDSTIPRGLMASLPEQLAVARANGIGTFLLTESQVSAEVVSDARVAGINVTAWLVNDPKRVGEMNVAGVTTIIVDDLRAAKYADCARCEEQCHPFSTSCG